MGFTKFSFSKILGDIFHRLQTQSLLPARERRRSSGPARTAPMAALEQRVLLAAFEDFETAAPPALPAGWTQATVAGQPTSWITGVGPVNFSRNVSIVGQNTNGATDTSLTSPSVAIHGANSQLEFQQSYNFESASPTTFFDGGMLEISIGGGSFTDIIDAGGTFVEGGYDGTISPESDSLTPNRACWGGDSGGIRITRVNLPNSAINQNVRFRWRFSSDSIISSSWGIDEIKLNDTDPDDQISEAPVSLLDVFASGEISHRRDVDMIAFDVTAGQTIVFDIDNAGFDSLLRLFDNQGNELAVNDDGQAPGESFSFDSFIRHTFQTTGRHHIAVSMSGNRLYSPLTGEGDQPGISNPGFYSFKLDAMPTVTVTMADTALKADETSLVTFAFSENVQGFDNSDVTVSGGTLSNVTTLNSGRTFTATFTPNSNVTDTTNRITVNNAGYTDINLNPGFAPGFGTPTTTSPNYTIDTARPTVEITMSDTKLTAGETSLVTFTFSEAVNNFSNADVQLSFAKGTLSTLTTANGGVTWTGTFTPNANLLTSGTFELNNTLFTDLAGNTGDLIESSVSFNADTAAPGTVQLIDDFAKQMLLISGTDGNDVISVAKAKGVTGGFIVTLNGVKSPVLVPTSRIVGIGRNGNDSIKLASSISLEADLAGGNGNDTLTGSAGDDFLIGGEGNDTLSGSTGNNILVGGNGDDKLTVSTGNSDLFGEAGNDSLTGSSGPDRMFGGDGNDTLNGSTGINFMFGENGLDKITGAGVLVGGNDNDTLTTASSRSIAIGGLGVDTLKSASKKGDILIGGTTDHDTSVFALDAILSEWASASPVQTRIDHLAGLLPGGRNGSFLLVSDAVRAGTVHNDGANDTFTNNFADDWLLPFSGDIRTKIIGRVNHA